MTIDELKNLVDEFIKENGVGAITGPILNNILMQILDYLSEHPGGGSVTIIDALDSYLTDAALSANQGRVLKDLIDNIEPGGGTTIIDNLDSYLTDAALSANMGRYLKSLIDAGTGLNYMRLSWEDYQDLADRGELSDNILYIVP